MVRRNFCGLMNGPKVLHELLGMHWEVLNETMPNKLLADLLDGE